ncbi:MAG: hypothetical protein AMXMBFR84_39630 [Candidatus Hydrogenedentota bacterium]
MVSENEREGTISLYDIESTAYVSLEELIKALGGGITVYTDRVKADLAGGTAWLSVGGQNVDASGGQFELKRPLLQFERKVYIALSDTVPFLESSFKVVATVDLDSSTGNAPDAPVDNTTPDSETLPSSGMDISNRSGSATVSPTVKVILIDPGHGGQDAGVEGKTTGLKEKDLTLTLALQLRDALATTTSARIVLTRDDDSGPTPEQRASMANTSGADLFISLHAGGSYAPGAAGFALFIGEGSRGQAAFAAQVARALEAKMIQAANAASLGIHAVPCRIFRNVQIPSILLEVGMLTSSQEETLLASSEYQEKLVQALAASIVDIAGPRPSEEPVQ